MTILLVFDIQISILKPCKDYS